MQWLLNNAREVDHFAGNPSFGVLHVVTPSVDVHVRRATW